MTDITPFITTIASFLISITFHEFCHALTAFALGDDTAQRMGRLTLNPLSHIDPIGLLFLILVRIGWAKPVPFNPQNFSRPRLYSVLVGLAGPFSNLVLALISLYAIRYIAVGTLLLQFFQSSVWINVMLGVFNLLPIPPLDGSHIIFVTIPRTWQATYIKLQPFSIILLVILLNIPAFKQAFFKTILLVIALLQQLVI